MGNQASKSSINLDTASRLDIICRRGDTFNLVLDFNQTMPTSGWKMEVREHDTDDATGTAVITMDSTITVSDGAETNSKITITKAASVMEDVASGLYVYDLQNTSNNVVKTYLYGTFKVNEDVTIS